MRFLLMSFFDESSVGLRSVGATLAAAGHNVHFLHVQPFLYELIPFEETEKIDALIDRVPLVARDVHPLGDVFVWADLLSDGDLELVVDHVGAVAPDAIGMSIVYARERPAAQVSRAVAQRFPRVPIIWGGIYPTLFPRDCLEHADIVCVGEGERPLSEWARDPGRTDIPGLWYRDGRRPICNEPVPPPPLEALPLPLYGHNERTVVDGALSSRCEDDPALIGRVFTFAASRGCRFDCSYCLSGRMRRKSKRPIRDRKSVDLFLYEIADAARRFDLPERIGLWDDIFDEDLEWLEEFARRYPHEAGIPFACQTHPHSCSPRAVELLVEAGVDEIAIGLEGGSPRVLREVYKRDPDVDRVIEATHTIAAAGVPSLQVDLLTNNPWETDDDCRDTLESLLRMARPFELELGKMVIYPGSRIASYDGPHGGLGEKDFDFWNMLYLLAQSDEIGADEIRALSRDDEYRRHPEKLRRMAHDLLSPSDATSSGTDEDASAVVPSTEIGGEPVQEGTEAICDVLLVGSGPLPGPDVTLTCAYQLRTAKLAWHLEQKNFRTRLVAVDLLCSLEDWYTAPRPSPVGKYTLIPQGEAGMVALRQIFEQTRPRAVLATSAPAAAMVCELAPPVPIWADMPGWLMPEAQLKAATSGNDGDLEVYRQLETAVLLRADKISVVCHNQLQVTLGEVGLLGRLSRRNLGYELLHRLPSLAFDWSRLIPPSDGGVDDLDPALPDDALILLWSGSFNVWTDVDRVFALLEQLMARLPRLHFVATGRRVPTYNDPICDRIEQLIEDASFRDRCHLLPWLPFADALGWFRRADLGLCIDGENLEVPHGSRTRLVDMLAHGLPAAATVGTELTHDLERAGAIVALDPARPETWPEKLIPPLTTPAELERLRVAGRKVIFAEYGLETACSELVDWLRDPRLAPENEFQVRYSTPVASPQSDGPDATLTLERPLATWRPQAEIEETAARAMSPTFGQPQTRLAARVLTRLLARPATRVPTLAAWNVATRLSRSRRLPHWQSWIETQLQQKSSGGLTARVNADSARRVYERALENGSADGARKSINVLLARYERDLSSGLVSRPQRIEVEPSSACNIRCRMCPLAHIDAAGSLMPPELFDTLVPYFATAPVVEFIGRGEPTLHPRLADFFEAATGHGCFVRMFTNGTRLTPELSMAMVRLGVHEVVLSLVAGNRRTYERVTGADRFDTVVENFRALRDIKRSSGSERPAVSLCSTLLRDSLDSAPDIVRTAAGLGITDIHFGAAYIVMPEMESESLLHLDPADVEQVFDECRRVATRYGVGVSLPPVGSQPDVCPPISDNRFGCLHPWLSVLIRADGNVELCSYNRKIIGDLTRQTVGEVWNGPEFEQFRLGKVRHEGIDYCDMCYHRAFRSGTTTRSTHFPYGITFDGYH